MTGAAASEPGSHTQLASYVRCVQRIERTWPDFTIRRMERLRQGLFDAPVEKVAENILEDLLTGVLDWDLADVNLQVGRADIVLSELGIKRLVLEVKRPGSLTWNRAAVERALDQACNYAAVQKVAAVAVSDGRMLYAADVANGGLRDRLFVSLDAAAPPLDLWWLSVHGIYRPCPESSTPLPSVMSDRLAGGAVPDIDGELLHTKYRLPARCFAYVGRADSPSAWKLPYRTADGAPGLKRLPKAIQAILSNYRGAKVSIPREAVPDVLVRLCQTAASLGKLPCQDPTTATAYAEAHQALDQLGRLASVGCCTWPQWPQPPAHGIRPGPRPVGQRGRCRVATITPKRRRWEGRDRERPGAGPRLVDGLGRQVVPAGAAPRCCCRPGTGTAVHTPYPWVVAGL